jgi:hypothetical protein
MAALVHHLRAVQIALLVVLFVLLVLTDGFPGVPWLRRFRLIERRPLSDAEKRAIRRRADRRAGMELIVAGLVTPFGAAALWAMFFREPSVTERVVALLVLPGALVGLGMAVIRKAR